MTGAGDIEKCERRERGLSRLATAAPSLGVYKQHVMETLTKKDHEDPEYRQFYLTHFKGGSPANHDIVYPTAVDAVRAVREQGGIPVLAHPGQMNSWESLPELVAAGLLGIEAFHPDHSAADEVHALDEAKRFDLLVTGGSDYHGKYGASPSLGTAWVAPDVAGPCVAELFERETHLG